MAKAYKCDRCGAYFDAPKEREGPEIIYSKIKGRLDPFDDRLDICDTCRASLRKWIESESVPLARFVFGDPEDDETKLAPEDDENFGD